MTRAMLVLGCLSLAAPAYAGPLVLSGAGGAWSGAQSTDGACIDYDNVGGSGRDEIRWAGGTLSTNLTTAQQSLAGGAFATGGDACMFGGALVWTSGYNFDPFDGSKVFGSGSKAFVLGDFDHLNYPVSAAVETVTYNMAINHNGNGGPLNLQFNFTHEETNNVCSGLGCSDDHVGVAFPTLTTLINVGSHTYLLELLGFSNNGIDFVNTFTSPEFGTTSTKLWAQVTQQNPVPEPATMALFGTGLLGIGAAVRRRLRASKGSAPVV